MININCYLRILVIFLVFICVLLLYVKHRMSTFVVPDVFETPAVIVPQREEQVHYLDSRYEYPFSPPVNPIAFLSEVKEVIKPDSDLYTPFNKFYEIDSEHSILKQPSGNTNELNYSGGSNVLIKIPLQMNEPNSMEQLRSQNELVTPYNKIKYSNEC
jgi:hypothetical protein